MTDETFLFDTYALVEILNKNPKYEKYVDSQIFVSDFIFAEFCYKIINEKILIGENLLNEIIPAIIYPSHDVIKKAMEFRVNNKKKEMSMTDCVSYMMAKELGIKFLTGDKQFENLEGVEFARK